MNPMNANKEDLLRCVEEAVSAETKDEHLILTYFHDCAQTWSGNPAV